MAQGPISVFAANGSATGRSWFVNEATGSDSNNGNAAAPFATLALAQYAARANTNDVVYLMGTSHTSSTVEWAKNGVSLVGLAAPSDNDRARISQTGSSVFTPLVNVTAQGCSFVNLGTFHGFNDASAQNCWAEAGGRNFYSNVQFLGMGNATAAAQAGSRSITVAGAGENLFVGCTVGLDTVLRATGNNASLEFLTGTPRNTFRQCIFQALVSNASDVHVMVGAGGIDRYALFERCSFMNSVDSTGTAMSVAFLVNASAGGSVLLQDCASVGSTVYATTGPIYVQGSVPTGATSGLAVKAT